MAHGSVDPPSSHAIEHVHHAYTRWDAAAIDFEKQRLSFVVFAIALGPIAVLMLAIQALAFPLGGPVALLLVGVEVVILIVAVLVPLLKMGRAHDRWIAARLRAEVLRREKFMLLARIGPYLNMGGAALHAAVAQRLRVLDDDSRDVVALLSMGDGRQNWRDAFEEQINHPGYVPSLDADVQSYVEERVVRQRQWFAKKRRDHERRSARFENAAKITLTLAPIVAAMHFGILAMETAGSSHPPRSFELLLLIVAIALPAIGSAFVALLSASGSERLARSYEYYAGALEALESVLLDIADNAASGLNKEDALQFRRHVLATEQLLSDELRQWWTIMALKHPRTT